MNSFKYLLLVLIISSCSTIKIEGDNYLQASNNPTLGSVLTPKKTLFNSTFKTVGFPEYKKPIKVLVSEVKFKEGSNSLYKSLDSLDRNKTLTIIDLADRIEVLQEINSQENNAIKNNLKSNASSQLVSGIILKNTNNIYTTLNKASKVFLEQDSYKNYVLAYYTLDTKKVTIQINKEDVVAFKTVKPCWKQNNQYSVRLVNLVSSDSKCQRGSYKSYKKANKSINLYKL